MDSNSKVQKISILDELFLKLEGKSYQKPFNVANLTKRWEHYMIKIQNHMLIFINNNKNMANETKEYVKNS